jgi:isopropylmalate/isohomocitrate dehydrogenase-like protein
MREKPLSICAIGGDGIGPEVVSEALRLLDATGITYILTSAEAGYGTYQDHGTPLPERTMQLCSQADAILFGAVTTPPNIPNYFSPIVRLRRELGLYANVRPFFSLPIESSRKGIDFVIVRENTEDLYSGQERETPEGAIAERVITRQACRNILKFAFELAQKQNRKTVTVVHKANVLRITDGLFLSIANEVAENYPNIEMNDILVDACAMQLIKKPEQFDVLVTTNMFGDILSDEAAALVGGLGIASSANIGVYKGLFEPIHGSAPKYEGSNKANPLATFYALCLLLENTGYGEVSGKIKQAILHCLESGKTTQDLGGNMRMSEFTDAVITSLKEK